ncbi:uncharacterized protein VTP21DRAFT_2533 [Calcarisporiella thermophila]|uniref:uncharacterized protein n=1 Tax=Calcarisporiella thermophila TaxID=911321 RepID=UPI0037437564
MTAFTTSAFAEAQLSKYGWSKGQGLGKNRDGIKKAISVSQKQDTKGVGSETDWGFAWWDHLYNKSTSKIQVEKDGEEIVVKKKGGSAKVKKNGPADTISGDQSPEASEDAEEQEPVEASTIASIIRTKLYSTFVKSSVSLNDPSTPKLEENEEDDDDKRDYSIKITDEELLAACEGRTARKGARGEQDGKLARVMGEVLAARSKDNDIVVKRKREEEEEEESGKKRTKSEDSEESGETVKPRKKRKEKKEKKEKKQEKEEKKKKEKKKAKKEKEKDAELEGKESKKKLKKKESDKSEDKTLKKKKKREKEKS